MSGDFPIMLSNSMASNPVGYLQSYVQGRLAHGQAGPDIPDFRVQKEYAQKQGGPFLENYKVSGNPSFDVNMPYIPGGYSFEGVPNASPEKLRLLQQRKLKNTGGQVLPQIKRV